MAMMQWQTPEEKRQEFERLAQEEIKNTVSREDLQVIIDVVLSIIDIILKIPLLSYELKSRLESLKGKLAP